MLVLVAVGLVACVVTVKASTNKVVVVASNDYQSSWNLMEMRNEKTWKDLQMVLYEPRLPQKKVETSSVQPKPKVSVASATSTAKLFLTKTDIVEEAQALKSAEMLSKATPENAWEGVGMNSVRTPDKREKLDIFSFRQRSWLKGIEVQYRDEYPVSSVGQTTQSRSLFVVWKRKF